MTQDTKTRGATAAAAPRPHAQIPVQPVRDLRGPGALEGLEDSGDRGGTVHETRTDDADRAGMDLLAAHVPLTLLLDLAGHDRPESREILLEERPSDDDLAWVGSH